MSSQAALPKSPAEKDDGLSKYMRRMKTVLKGGTRSNRASVSSIGEIMGESSKTGATATATTKTTSPAAQDTSKSTKPVYVHKWSSLQEEKARTLFAKYGLTLEPGEWITGPTSDREVERVEKPIRMRVRRNCHRCLTNFGADKVCSKCDHLRCKKCFRYPPPKPKDAANKDRAADGKKDLKPAGKKEKVVLTIPSRTGGQDLVRKLPRQRVRRNCHVCSTLFEGNATECQQCKHVRCKKCPRDPPKLSKYPDGYPGDAEPPFEPQERVWRKPRRRVRWTCHSCSILFSSGEKECSKCQHERCKDCTRDPPKKIKPEPDPEILRRVEEKLAQINVS